MKTSLFLILLIIVVGCSSTKMDMTVLNNRTYYVYAYNNQGERRAFFPFLPYNYIKDTIGDKHFQVEFKGDSLYVTCNILKDGVPTRVTQGFKGKLKKNGWEWVSRSIVPFFPIYFYSSVDKDLIYPDAENNMRVESYSSTDACLLLFCAGRGGGWYSNTYKNEKDIKTAIPYIENGKYGLNKQGEVLVPPVYDFITLFDKGIAKVKKDSLWGVMNDSGKLVIPVENEVLEEQYNTEPTLFMVKKDNRWGFLNLRGETVLPIVYDIIDRDGSRYFLYSGTKRGFFKYYKTDKYDESKFIPAIYTKIDESTLYNDYVLVYDGDTMFFVDKEGRQYNAEATEVRKIDRFFGYPERNSEVKIGDKYYRPIIP